MALFEEKFPEIERYLEDNASAEPDIQTTEKRNFSENDATAHDFRLSSGTFFKYIITYAES